MQHKELASQYMTATLDTARAEVLQRSREDRRMKLIKLQNTATETHCGMFGTTGQLRCRYVEAGDSK